MSADCDVDVTPPLPTLVPSLERALNHGERVKGKVEEAAVELSDVNAALKEDIATGAPLVRVQDALAKTQKVEEKVQEAADELTALNQSLAEEVTNRDSLEHRALHDAVTALPNVTLFCDRLELALEQAQRHGWRLAVLFLDLDRFKVVNDTCGHDIGDRVLQTVASRLSDSTRGGDSVARRGGDEFLILMLEVQADATAVRFAAKLGKHLAQPMCIDGHVLTVGASIGVAVYPDDATTGAALLKHADSAMYVAKKGNLGVVRYAPESTA